MINGAGDYWFMLTATDGQVNGGGEVDKFRIKIWDTATTAVVYDNVPGASDDLDAATLERARENIGTGRGNRDRPPAHRAGIVEQERHDGIAEFGVLFGLE